MAKFRGKVVYSDLEGGFWTFESDDGTTYKLEGCGGDLLKEGVLAELDGQLEEDAMGFGFGTPILVVNRYKILPSV